MIKISYIQEYVTLAETLNFSKTAQMMYITQPALSRHITAIEEDLGARLLERTTRNVVLTPAGKIAYEHFKVIRDSYHETKNQITALTEVLNGNLQFHIPYYWAEQYAEPVIQTFFERNPECHIDSISCQPPTAIREVMNRRTDLALCYELANTIPGLQKTVFAKEPLAVFLSDRHPLASREILEIEDLAHETLMMLRGYSEYPMRYPVQVQALLKAKTTETGHMEYSQQIDTLAPALAKTQAVAVLPYDVRKMGRSYMKAIPLAGNDAWISMCLYYRADNDNPLIPEFVRTAEEMFKNENTEQET